MTLVFLKLGGSLITDKTQDETPRLDTIKRIASTLSEAYAESSDLRLLVGHGSGSFGHVYAKKYGTRQGVYSAEDWAGFSKVSVAAARLNNLMLEAFAQAGLPVFRVQPSASARCEDGVLVDLSVRPIEIALEKRLVPLVYGDVAVDTIRGGTIISTEEIFEYLARRLVPERICLAGDFDAVLDHEDKPINFISPESINSYKSALGSAEGTDVTGGMYSKVMGMLSLCSDVPGLSIYLFSGHEATNLSDALLHPANLEGTRISA